MSNITKNDDFVDAEIVEDVERQYARFEQTQTDMFSLRLIGSMGLFGIFVYIFYGFLQIWIGLAGLELYFDTSLAVIGGIFLMLLLRTTMHLTLGGYYYLTHALGWDWYFAILFLIPSLLLFVPGFLFNLIVAFRRVMKRY